MIFYSGDSLFKHLKHIYRPHHKIFIASFGMYLGITNDADFSIKFPSAVRNFINSVNPENMRILVGLPFYSECSSNCKNCREKYNNALARHKKTAEKLQLNTRYMPDLHLKFFHVGGTYITGGINLSTSNAADVSLVIDKIYGKRIQRRCDILWGNATTDITEFYKLEDTNED